MVTKNEGKGKLFVKVNGFIGKQRLQKCFKGFLERCHRRATYGFKEKHSYIRNMKYECEVGLGNKTIFYCIVIHLL